MIKSREVRYKNLIQSLPVAIYACDKNGFIRLYNNAAIELWGREPEIGKEHWCGSCKIFKLDDSSLALSSSPMALTLKGESIIYGEEMIIQRPDGAKRYVQAYPQAVYDDNGAISGAINTLIDITEIRKTQRDLKSQEANFHQMNLESEQLRAKELEERVHSRTLELIAMNKELKQKNEEVEESRKKLLSEYSRSLIEASLDPLITISSKGKITDMNKAFKNVTNKSREELRGSDFFNYFTDPQKAREVYKEVFKKGFVTDYPLTIKDEKLTEVLFNGSIYKDEQGNVLGAVVVARDINEQKNIEKELLEAKVLAELATIIAETAKEKAEEATLFAEEAMKSKQQFLSNMSHEIRTPMNAIIGFTKVLLKTDISTKQGEYLNAIKTSGDALIVLINDILDLAKVDSGKMTFEQVPFKLSASIAAMLHLFETKIQEKNLELLKQYDIRIPEVLIGDPVRLHQIILNLVSNAVKFTNIGKITVSVDLLHEDEDSVNIKFSVTDTGIGISHDKIENIFENFQQASSSTSRLFGGTGLGLAISKQLVEHQQGSISVKSVMDEGSVFSFILSFIKSKDDTILKMEMQEFNTDIKNISILVVEDMPLNQLLMKTLLDDFGFKRDIAENGKIAIEKLQANTYDIILMDLQMPEMNGFEATEYIRNSMHSSIPIVALTADVTTVDLAKCKAVGMNDYLAKPIDERQLFDKIIGLIKTVPVMQVEETVLAVVKQTQLTDLSYLIQRTRNNSALILEMISAYLAQTPPLIIAMKQGLLNEDWKLLHSAAHKMIPSFSIMGMSPEFELIAKKIMDYQSPTQVAAINDLVLQLDNICTTACKELELEFNRIKKTTHEQ